MESKKLIAYYALNAFYSIGVYDVIYDIDDYLLICLLREGQKVGHWSKCKIFNSPSGREYIRTHGMYIYLDDIIRVNF